jgi:MFS family permease
MANSVIFTAYASDILGMTKEDAGFIGSFAFLAGACQIFSFMISNRIKNKKLFVIGCGLLETLFLCAALLPGIFMAASVSGQVVFVALVFMVAICSHLARPTINNWLAGLMPQAGRGRYFAIRWLILCCSRLLIVKLAFWFVNRNSTIGGFAIVFLCGAAFAAVSYLLLTRVTIPPEARESDFNFRDMLAAFKHKPFKDYFCFMVALHLGFGLACSYYGPFFLMEVGLTLGQISNYIVAYNIMLILGMLPAGKLVDRFGARPLIYVMVLIYTVFFLMFPFVTRDRLWLITIVWAFVGLGDGLFFVAGNSALFHSLPKGRARMGALALGPGIVFLLMGIAPLVSRLYLGLSDTLEFTIMGERIEKFRLMFAVIGLLVLASIFFVRRIADTHEPRMPRKYRGRNM